MAEETEWTCRQAQHMPDITQQSGLELPREVRCSGHH